MLGKLVKYDLLYNWKFFVGAMAAIFLWGVIGFPQNTGVAITVTAVLTPVLLALIVLCVVFVLRYYGRAMYGGQGYLTMTLPTSAANILGAKVVTTAIWFNALLVVAFLSVGLYTREFADMFEALFSEIGEVLRLWLQWNISMLSTLLAVYLAITVANVSVRGKRFGALGGIACYILWSLASSLLYQLVYKLVLEWSDKAYASYDTYSSLFGILFSGLGGWYGISVWVPILFNLAMATIAFFLNLWLIRKKVSLQ